MKNNHNINAIALLIGAALIFLIAVITIIPPYFSNKKINTTKAILPKNNIETKNPNLLSSAQLAAKITSTKNLVLLDIRNKEDYAWEHLIDSINMPPDVLKEKIAEFSKDNTYVIIDDGEQNGLSVAMDFFPKNGLPAAFYLDGGFPAWKADLNSTVSAGDPGSFTDQSKVTYINSQNLKALIEKEDNLFLIDLRSKENYANEHIKGAVNIPLDDLEKRRNEIPFGKKIVLYDKDGLWAFQGAVRLFDLGTFNVLTLSDGLDAWKQKKFELSK